MDVQKHFPSHLFIFIGVTLSWTTYVNARMDHCYLTDDRAQRCLPPFVNAAFGRTVIASDTCGSPPEQFCLQTGVTGVTKSCHVCDSAIPSQNHDSSFLTDFNNEDVTTWWQSRTMLHAVQFPNMVNLTLNLNKAFDITYVRLLFHTSRPESFAIYKKKCEECDWQPFQYYSGSCFTTYGIDNKEIVTNDNEQKPLCTDDFSDISPLTGGNVAFSTLESRPSAYNFDNSPVLQDWVKAVAIRITLNRINTFGDEVFRDPKILKSYYYAISDLSIGGRCTCNGHASECFVGPGEVLQCRCEHHTAGRDCERCADFYNDRPWARGTKENPAECKACDCNGLSETCYFDLDLYQQTGHGGHCTNCRNNTDGPNCSYCQPYFFRDSHSTCVDCQCNSIGSLRQQCDSEGNCFCKPGVGGAKCDRCLDNHYGLNQAGCQPCLCSEAGTKEGTMCDSITGHCVCKLNVEGAKCDRCIPTTMNLQQSNPFGCTACFCHGHSSVCELSEDYTVAYVVSEFLEDADGWQGIDVTGNAADIIFENGNIAVTPLDGYRSYFVAPEKFLGVQRFSYNQFLEFELSVSDSNALSDIGSGDLEDSVLPDRWSEDIVLEGEGIRVTTNLLSQNNSDVSSEQQLYRFRLHETLFTPQVSPVDFQKMLNKLDKLYVIGTFGDGREARLSYVRMKTAERRGAGPRADWVERCELDGYLGEFTGACAPGFTRDPPNGGVYAPCVPCNCNGHSTSCDPDSGVCTCIHNTVGDNCDLCEEGYYFGGDESRRGTPQECQPCPCPEKSSCSLIHDGSVVCTSCPEGHAGPQCEICMDGWFGEPRGRGPCLRCLCNGNIDPNAVMNCNRTTGECLKCIHNTTGYRCESCLPGYFGKAVTNNPEERCRLCDCNSLGSSHSSTCNILNGKCTCRPNVDGRQCDRCKSGFWDLASGEGCISCNCHPIGSSTGECDQDSGQCECLPGVTGQRCDHCLPNYYGLTRVGCTACKCNPDGSLSLQCDEDGRCSCKGGVLGIRCDQCQENYYDLENGCKECPTCYSLVQNSVEDHRTELSQLEHFLDTIGDQPAPLTNHGNANFKREMNSLNDTAYRLLNLGKRQQEIHNNLNKDLDDLNDKLQELVMKLAGVEDNVDHCNETVQEAGEINGKSRRRKDQIREIFHAVNQKLKAAMMDLNVAQRIADDSSDKENNMSKLAHEAEDLANRHRSASQVIVDTAQSAYDMSKKAQELIQQSIELMDQLMTSLEDLAESESKIPAAKKLREDLLAQSGVVKNITAAARDSSTSLYSQAVKLIVPGVDTDAMDRDAQRITAESEELLPLLKSLDDEYRNNFGELQTERLKAQDFLQTAIDSQNNADKLLAQVDSALEASLESIERGNKTYHDLLDTITTLRSFNDEISQNRENANAALANVETIRNKIEDAVATTADTKRNLGEARKIATQASEKAQQAKDIAEGVQTNAQAIRSQADQNHDRAGRISEQVSSLSESLLETETRLDAAENQAEEDRIAINEATTSATEAKKAAETAKRKVDNVLRQLQQLLDRLNTSPDVTDDEIGELEINYKRLSDEVDDADIDAAIKRLQKEVRNHRSYIRSYDDQIRKLRQDIVNLEKIRAAIPTVCSSVAVVEQP